MRKFAIGQGREKRVGDVPNQPYLGATHLFFDASAGSAADTAHFHLINPRAFRIPHIPVFRSVISVGEQPAVRNFRKPLPGRRVFRQIIRVVKSGSRRLPIGAYYLVILFVHRKKFSEYSIICQRPNSESIKYPISPK